MTRTMLMLSAMAAGLLAGCASPAGSPSSAVSAAPNGPAMSQFTSTPVAGLPECKQYSATATIDGKPQPLNGEACRLPDGSWHIAEQPAGTTIVYQTVYWPPTSDVAYDACFDDPYYGPCLYDFPFGFSVGFPVFIDIHHHFDRFVYASQFHRFGPTGHFGPMDDFADGGGFHHAFLGGFPNGFHDGLHDGFHDGFHGGFGGGFHGQFPGGFSGGGFHHR
jgi:hypothetical protein